MKTALVTGGNGFIGRYVNDELRRLGITPIVYDIEQDNSVLDYYNILQVASETKVDGIIHLAGVLGTHELYDYLEDAVMVNIVGAVNVAKVALELQVPMVSIEQPHIWKNPYEATKGAARRILLSMFYEDGLQLGFVTAHNAFGPGQHFGEGHPQKIIPTFSTLAWQSLPIPIWGDGQQKVNLVYAGDVARMMVSVLLDPAKRLPDQVHNAGSNMLWSVADVAWFVKTVVDSPSEIQYLPMRRGEQGWVDYPEPDGSYPFRLDEGILRQTINSYRPDESGLPY